MAYILCIVLGTIIAICNHTINKYKRKNRCLLVILLWIKTIIITKTDQYSEFLTADYLQSVYKYSTAGNPVQVKIN